MLNDPVVHAHASRVSLVPDGNPDQNAIVPQRVVVRLQDGAQHEVTVEAIYGHPDAALSDAENVDKFRRCCSYAAMSVPANAQDALIELISRFEDVEDVAVMARLLPAPVS
jgi:2-methylcitrate dehydratase PrpD